MQRRSRTDPTATAPQRAAETEEPPYEGDAGRTRLDWVHVTIPGGYVRSIKVYKTVNIATDPQLREAALHGALHRFEGGEELAIPFLFHDPQARKFALVLPEVLRHEELKERAQLLTRLAEDTTHTVPSYVHEATVVIGPRELERYLASESHGAIAELANQRDQLSTDALRLAERDQDLASREQNLTRRSDALTKREQDAAARMAAVTKREKRLEARAEEVTRREDEIRLVSEQLEAAERDLAMRQQELDGRALAVRQREESVSVASKRPLSSPPPASRPLSRPPSMQVEAVPLSDEDAGNDVEEIDDIDELEAIGEPTDLAASVEMVEDSGPLVEADVEEIVDENDVEEIEDIEALREVTGVGTAPEATTEQNRLAEEKTSISTGTLDAPAASAPAEYLGNPELEMAFVLTDRLWLFARLDEGMEDAFNGPDVDLLTQLVVVQGYPVVILTLVEGEGGDRRSPARRLALDPERAEHATVLERLRKSYEATAVLTGIKGEPIRTIQVSAPRRVNVAMVLERVQRTKGAARIDAATAMERALAAPPPIRESSHPFRSEEPPPVETALGAMQALDNLADWSTPERLDRALLALSIPRDVVDGTMRRVLDDAVRFGIALSPSLLGRAVSLGVAAEPGEVVARQLQQFVATASTADRGGMSPEASAENWERLLAAASEAEVPVDDAIHEIAWEAMSALKGKGGEGLPVVDASALPQMGGPELVMLLDHPKIRRAAALELCRRSDPEYADRLFKAVRKMGRSEVVRIVPRILDLGESAGDALIDGLSARKTFVRQVSALALGHLRLRRAVVPLVHLLSNEPSGVWREVARILGEFGTGSLRALSRGLKDPKASSERFALALAHLTQHGCEAQVRQLAEGGDERIRNMVKDSMTLRDVVQGQNQQVRGHSPIEGGDPVLQFSRRFYEELAGTAPDVDLAEALE